MANNITTIRLLCCIALFFCPVFSAEFYFMYIAAGLTDILDGFVARKTDNVTEFGAKFDTASDFVFVVVCFIRMFPELDIPVWIYVWTAAIAIIKIANVVFGYVTRKKIIALHTVMNKVTGALLLVLPLTFSFVDIRISAIVVCAVATFAAVQEGYFIKNGRDR